MSAQDPVDVDESTPLHPTAGQLREAVYKRFSPARKRWIVAIVSFTGLLPLFVSGTFIPSIPAIAKDLNTTPAVVGLAVSLSVLAASIGALIGASYSSFYGRRIVYLIAMPLLALGSVGTATAETVFWLLFWRFVQALGASPGISVGSGVIGDIYKLEERGSAMGIFFAAVLLGPAIAPVAGGLAAKYASWRVMQHILGASAVVCFLLVFAFLPETYHPGLRGIDKMPADKRPKWRPVLLNPLSPLALMRSPALLAVTFAGLFVLLTDYVLLLPIAFTLGKRYGIHNEALIGACFLPVGLGNMIGAPLAGRLSDYFVVRNRRRRGGEWYPEDRLIVTVYGAATLVPLSLVISALLIEYVPGKIGLVGTLICFFANGVGVDLVLSPSAAYFVDLLHSRSAEAMAANNGFRSFFMSLAIAGILPALEKHGLLLTNFVSAALGWVAFLLLWATVRYGDKLRAFVDVGFATADNN